MLNWQAQWGTATAMAVAVAAVAARRRAVVILHLARLHKCREGSNQGTASAGAEARALAAVSEQSRTQASAARCVLAVLLTALCGLTIMATAACVRYCNKQLQVRGPPLGVAGTGAPWCGAPGVLRAGT